MLVLLSLSVCGVDDGMGLNAVSDSSTFGILAGGVDGVDDGVGHYGVANDSLVVHYPHVHQAALWVYIVIGVSSVVLQHLLSSFTGGHLEPLDALFVDGEPGLASLFEVCGGCGVVHPW